MSNDPSSAEPGLARLPAEWWLRVGHDLRGSIAPMRMAVQLLKTGRVAESDREDALQLIDRQIDALVASVDDLSDLLRLSAGTLALGNAPNDLNLILDAVCGRGALTRALQDRRQTLECIPLSTALIAEHDPLRLAALVEFLVRKSSEHAGPDVSVSLEVRRDAGRARFLIGGGKSLAVDPDLAYVAGAASAGNGEAPSTKAILMREIARLNGLEFDAIDDKRGIEFSLAAIPD
jgi:signal transduction histidine kinase